MAHINVSDDSEDEGAEEGDQLTPFSPMWGGPPPPAGAASGGGGGANLAHRRRTTAGLPVSLHT